MNTFKLLAPKKIYLNFFLPWLIKVEGRALSI